MAGEEKNDKQDLIKDLLKQIGGNGEAAEEQATDEPEIDLEVEGDGADDDEPEQRKPRKPAKSDEDDEDDEDDDEDDDGEDDDDDGGEEDSGRPSRRKAYVVQLQGQRRQLLRTQLEQLDAEAAGHDNAIRALSAQAQQSKAVLDEASNLKRLALAQGRTKEYLEADELEKRSQGELQEIAGRFQAIQVAKERIKGRAYSAIVNANIDVWRAENPWYRSSNEVRNKASKRADRVFDDLRRTGLDPANDAFWPELNKRLRKAGIVQKPSSSGSAPARKPARASGGPRVAAGSTGSAAAGGAAGKDKLVVSRKQLKLFQQMTGLDPVKDPKARAQFAKEVLRAREKYGRR